MLADLNRDGMTVIMVTHNLAHTHHAGRHLRLRDGLIVDPAEAPTECPAAETPELVGSAA